MYQKTKDCFEGLASQNVDVKFAQSCMKAS